MADNLRKSILSIYHAFFHSFRFVSLVVRTADKFLLVFERGEIFGKHVSVFLHKHFVDINFEHLRDFDAGHEIRVEVGEVQRKLRFHVRMRDDAFAAELLHVLLFVFEKEKKKHQRHEHRRNQRKRRAMVRALRFVFFHAKHVVLRQFGRNHHRVSGVQLFRRCCAAKSRLDSRNRKMPQNQ